MAGKTFQKESYYTFNISVLQCLAMWPFTKTSSSIFLKMFNVLHACVVHILLVHIFVLCMDTILHWEGHFDDVAQFVTHSICYCITPAIVGYFQVRHSAFDKLVQFLNKNFRIRSSVGLNFMTIQPCYEYATRMSKIWTFLGILCCMHMALYPIITSSNLLPIAVTYPFDTEHSPGYEIVYLIQVITQLHVGVVFANLGTFYMAVMIMICGQYDILLCSLKNVRNTAMLKHGVSPRQLKKMQTEYENEEKDVNEYYCGEPSSENLNNYFKEQNQKENQQNGTNPIVTEETPSRNLIESYDLRAIPEYVGSDPSVRAKIDFKDNYLTEYNKELTDSLADCVEHHLTILRCCKMMDDLYSPFMLIKLFQISFLLCFLTYNISTNLVTADIKFLNNMEYLSLAAGEIFLFCYYGNMVTIQNERVGAALLRSPWHLCGGQFRRGLSIILAASCSSVHLTAGKFFILNLDTFRSLISASFSYFNVLRSMQE